MSQKSSTHLVGHWNGTHASMLWRNLLPVRFRGSVICSTDVLHLEGSILQHQDDIQIPFVRFSVPSLEENRFCWFRHCFWCTFYATVHHKHHSTYAAFHFYSRYFIGRIVMAIIKYQLFIWIILKIDVCIIDVMLMRLFGYHDGFQIIALIPAYIDFF